MNRHQSSRKKDRGARSAGRYSRFTESQLRERSRRRKIRRRKQRIRTFLLLGILAVLVILVFVVLVSVVRVSGGRKSGEAAVTTEAASGNETGDSGAAGGGETAGSEESASDESAAAESTADSTAAESTGNRALPEIPGADNLTDSKGNQPPALAGEPVSFFSGYQPDASGAGAIEDPEVNSTNAILVDMDTGKVVAARDADAVISPASMTKILTVLVAAEHVKSLDDTVTITQEIADFIYKNDCTMVGWKVGDTATVRDLLFGTILPSGADAAIALAEYTAGSTDAFVDMMNQKAADLGLSATAHFSNCIGIYSEDNRCTVKDMAMILKATLENDLARQILSTHIWTTGASSEHPDGIELSNWFLRRIEDKDSKGTVLAAKTGYVVQSGNNAASYNVANNGKHYICVTTGAHSAWRCIYDHVAIYDEFLG